MGAIVGLPMIIFAVLFLLGIIELIIGAIILITIIIKKKKKKLVLKRYYVTFIILAVFGLGSIIPLIGTHILFNNIIESESPKVKQNKKITITYKEDEESFFMYDGTKYVSLNYALENDLDWIEIYLYGEESAAAEKLQDNPIAKAEIKSNIIDNFKESEGHMVGFILMTFYGDLMQSNFVYDFEDGYNDFLVVSDSDISSPEIYVPENKLDIYLKTYSDIDNYNLTLENNNEDYLQIKLSDETINEVKSNAQTLFDFNSDKYVDEKVDYEKLISEKNLKLLDDDTNEVFNNTQYLRIDNEELQFHGLLADLYKSDEQVYQIATIYLDESDDNVLNVYIKLSDKASKELLKYL